MIPSPVDLTNCEREPIHILGHVQSYGFLVAVQPGTQTVVHASENLAHLAGVPASQLLGQPVQLLAEIMKLPADVLAYFSADNPTPESRNYLVTLNGINWNLILHQYNGLILLEWEPAGDERDTFANNRLVTEALADVQRNQSITDLLQHTAQRVKTIIGFDRVMVYRFSDDWNGRVIAEAKDAHLDSFLDLHYPASDIPKQARELYKINLVRIIADVGSTPARILSAHDWPADAPLDLTQSVLRAVSPVHIQYLKNMGVQASMSISLLYRGELWGLISCHNATPRFVDYPARQAAKFVSQLLSVALEFRQDNENQANLIRYQQAGQQLNRQLLQTDDVARALTKLDVDVRDVTNAAGAALFYNNTCYCLGQTPPEEAIRGVADWLTETSTDALFQTSQLPNLYAPAKAFRAAGTGLLAIVLSKELNEYVFWFKPERVEEVTWAGNPNKSVTVAPDGSHQLSPRTSFAAWTEQVRNTAEPWTDAEITTVQKLREDMVQVISDNAIRVLNQRLKVAYDELDAFSYTVSHDLRTPLSSIRCYTEILVEEYGPKLDEDAQLLLQKVVDSSERMRRLIRHILYYSRMGRSELEIKPVNMRGLLTRICDEMMATANGRSLQINIAETPPLEADFTMMLQLFTNLIGNAVKYTQPVADACIQVEGHQTEEDVIYSIKDNGIGFDMKQAGKMFDLFKRLENARNIEGTGVGLAIVKRIVDRHQGKIWFHSEPNKGTTFFVSFPVTYIL